MEQAETTQVSAFFISTMIEFGRQSPESALSSYARGRSRRSNFDNKDKNDVMMTINSLGCGDMVCNRLLTAMAENGPELVLHRPEGA
ncbi:MAG: hypothetical protein JF615_03195 [Asticcacaulis sp.]|nr:hypothetical protein [Asticcacaulis sp.]